MGSIICAGCGKQFANRARLRRHLLHSSGCRVGWGSFLPDSADRPARPNEAAPPVQIAGQDSGARQSFDPATYSKGLLDALAGLECPTAEEVWSEVVEFVEPLETLRATLHIWQSHFGHKVGVQEAAEDALLMLDPSLCCDSYCSAKAAAPAPTAECCGELPGPFPSAIPFILSGAFTTYRLDSPLSGRSPSGSGKTPGCVHRGCL